MGTDLTGLVSVLENEIAVGEELYRNLEAQKKAIIAWDLANLLGQIEAKEPWLRSLSQLEEKRREILKGIGATNSPITLRQIIAKLPQGGSESARLDSLRERTQRIFTRLHAEEQNLHELMRNVLAHIQEALGSLAHPLDSVYSKSGVALPTGTRSSLLHGKA
ncbi:MAG TPA: flagellar protein FlgN [Methylomirabilota bacterium]|nr:flagellar protein FlgN [Methylomirabilota bacterium]